MPPEAHALILAAGAGQRFGGGKLLANWQGQPLIAAAVQVAARQPVRSVSITVGADGERVAAAARAAWPDVRVIACPDWATGLSASLRAGIAALPPSAEAVLIFLGDMPAIPPFLGAQLLGALAGGAPAALVRHQGRPAHPAAFAAACFADLMDLCGDRGARPYAETLPGTVYLDCEDPGCVHDIDRPDDLCGPHTHGMDV